MVTHVSFAVDDETANRAKAIKEDKDLSWPEFLELSVDTLKGSEELERYAELREEATTVVPTGEMYDVDERQEWRDLECGCRWTIGVDGQMYVIVCDEHDAQEATTLATEAYENE